MNTLMIFAAGLGTRMRPITDSIPKSLVRINDKPLLWYALRMANYSGCSKVIVNAHYFAEQIEGYLKQWALETPHDFELIVEVEPVRLETGGGLKSACEKYFANDDAVFTLNSDNIIILANNSTDGIKNLFNRMREEWNSSKMDSLMLLQNVEEVVGESKAEFCLNDDGIILKADGKRDGLLYTGLQLISLKDVLANADEVFSLSKLFRVFVEKQRMYGICNVGGKFFHVSRPEDIEETHMVFQHLCKGA